MQTPHVAPAHHDSDGGRLDEPIFLPEKASTPAASVLFPKPAAPSRQRPTLRPFHKPADGQVAQDWSPFAWQKGRLSESDVASRPSVQLPSSSSLVSFGTSSCAGVLRLSQVHFSERIGAKARSRRRPPAAKQGSAKTCKSQTCPCHSPSPSILGSLRLSVSPRSHSAILKKKKTGVTCAWPLFFFWFFPENCLPSLLD